VPADEHTPRRQRVLSKDRVEGFSDGVFGFAATLLVLDLALRPPGTPLQQVLHGWPGYLAYLASFLTIGGAWLLHTALTDQLTRVDQLFLRLNLLVLLVVVFLPFPTGLVAESLRHADSSAERVYVTLYGLTLLAIRLLGSALDAYARQAHLYAPKGEGEELHSTPGLADDRAQGRLRLLGDGEQVVLHVHRGLDRAHHPEVHHRVHPDGHVVPGDALLSRNRHRDDLHVDLLQPVTDRPDHPQSRAPRRRGILRT
jgi:uncharacterized membrane protein